MSDPGSDPGLVSDCVALLSTRDTLAGSATLNWSEGTLIQDWDGVRVGGSPQRITDVHLAQWQLSGSIPAEFGALSNLTWLYLGVNQLSGPIPPELGGLYNLKRLYLDQNQLSGTIPPELGGLYNLELLHLYSNQLSGTIPQELENLSNLMRLYLRGNRLSGCIPEGLRDVLGNDLDRLGLPFCGPATVTESIAGTSTMVRIDSPIPVTATFSEPVFGFTVEDISVANGSVGNFVGSDGDTVYTFDVTPNAIGEVTVYIAAAVVEDGDGNANTAAVHLSLGIPYDDDHNGAISRQEVIAAIGDYLFSGLLTRDQIIALISLYLFG